MAAYLVEDERKVTTHRLIEMKKQGRKIAMLTSYDYTMAQIVDQAGMDKIVDDFVDAAKAAKEMGFDGIQLHCAHGYLLSQFLDPNSNHRADDFGGSAENRFRFPGRCLSAIRQAVGPDYPLLVKINTNCAGEADAQYAEDILWRNAEKLLRV